MMPRRLARLAKTRYLVYVRIGEPARKHGIADQDITQARHRRPGHTARRPQRGHRLRARRADNDHRRGQERDTAGIGILGKSSDEPVIVHAMTLRPRFRKHL
jgi:hypothetical protein